MIITEELTNEDLKQIDDIYRKYHEDDFFIPSLAHTITYASVKNNEKIVAFGMVKLFPEAILVMNKGASHREQVIAWRMLMNYAIPRTRAQGHRYLHATIHNQEYSNLLSKHYGFKVSDGKQITLEL